jgi:hypothetical protein
VRLALAGPDDDPFWIFEGLGPQLGLLLVLASVAVFVIWYSRRKASRRGLGARGKSRRPDWADPAWRTKIGELEQAPAIPIASATATTVRVTATIASAPSAIAGPPERACVWLNDVGASEEHALAVEIVFVADDSGRCALEGLQHARVIAPRETTTRDKRTIALYVGDKVDIFGTFAPERAGDDPDPKNLVYGTLGAGGLLEIRVIERPERAATEGPPP